MARYGNSIPPGAGCSLVFVHAKLRQHNFDIDIVVVIPDKEAIQIATVRSALSRREITPTTLRTDNPIRRGCVHQPSQ